MTVCSCSKRVGAFYRTAEPRRRPLFSQRAPPSDFAHGEVAGLRCHSVVFWPLWPSSGRTGTCRTVMDLGSESRGRHIMVSSLRWSVGITLKPARGQPDTQAGTVTGKPTASGTQARAASAVAGQLGPSPPGPGRLLLARGGAGPPRAQTGSQKPSPTQRHLGASGQAPACSLGDSAFPPPRWHLPGG
jgi:hypothetical protein